jgi:hypothetical protein
MKGRFAPALLALWAGAIPLARAGPADSLVESVSRAGSAVATGSSAAPGSVGALEVVAPGRVSQIAIAATPISRITGRMRARMADRPGDAALSVWRRASTSADHG